MVPSSEEQRQSAEKKGRRTGRKRPTTKAERAKAWRGILVTLALLAVVLVGPGVWTAVGYVRDQTVARDLSAHGTTIQVHDAQVKVQPSGYQEIGVDQYRVPVPVDGTTHEATLVAAHADTSHLPTRHWIAAPKPYKGTFDVVVDPTQPDRAMTKADMAWVLSGAPLQSSLALIGVFVAAILGLGTLLAFNSGLIGKHRRGDRPRS